MGADDSTGDEIAERGAQPQPAEEKNEPEPGTEQDHPIAKQ